MASTATLNLGAVRGFPETVTRVRAARRTDSDGNMVVQRDWSDTDDLTIIGVNVQPLGGRETQRGDARAVSTQWVMITRPRSDVDITAGDRIVWGARTFAVVGEPEHWPHPTGGVDHVEAVLEVAPPWPGAGGDTTDGHLSAGTDTVAAGVAWTVA